MDGNNATTISNHLLLNRINIMRTLSSYFFMEVLVKKLQATVDKFATLDIEGTTIIHNTRDNPKRKQSISLDEGKRIFEDLYGSIDHRYIKSDAYLSLESRKAKAKARRAFKKGTA